MTIELYNQTEFKTIIKDIHGLLLPFDENWKKIGVTISGGADSALLGYLICQLITDLKLPIDVHVITNIRGWKTKPWQQYNSLDVYRYLIKKFNNVRFVRHENFVPPELEWGNQGPMLIDEYGKKVSGDNIELRAFAEYVGFNEHLDAYFNAVTKNPDRLDNGVPNRYIEPTIENIHMLIMKHMDKIASHPFRFTTKDWIYKKYLELDLLDLFELTRSCEGEFENLNYKNYVPGQYVPLCKQCFWCKEREWAIEQSK